MMENKNTTINMYVGQMNYVRDNARIHATQNNGNKNCGANEDVVKFKNNKKENYVDNWNSRLFLHQDQNEQPITLENTFIMPDYKMLKSVGGIGFSSNDTLKEIIDKFKQFQKTSTMLITGVPGIGKSSITSWIANR